MVHGVHHDSEGANRHRILSKLALGPHEKEIDPAGVSLYAISRDVLGKAMLGEASTIQRTGRTPLPTARDISLPFTTRGDAK